MQLIFATHNKNKSKEVKSIIPHSIIVSDLSEIGYHKEIEETADTIEGNALLKAHTIFNETGINCFSDDSGLLVDALHGAPGVYSARYAGEHKNDEDNLQKLLKELAGKENRKAHFKTVIVILIDGKEQLFEGIINGTISHKKKGSEGFGYDPIFIPDGYQRSFAEMSIEEKSTISHRALALKKMIEFLKTI